MLQLQYTKNDLIANTTLRDTVQMLQMLGATHDGTSLSYSREYKVDVSVLPYAKVYICMIKMPSQDREGQVYENIQGREQDGRILSWSERKDENFDEPFEHEGFVYVPHDIHNGPMDGGQIQVMVNNGCELLTISEYKSWRNEEFPIEDIV